MEFQKHKAFFITALLCAVGIFAGALLLRIDRQYTANLPDSISPNDDNAPAPRRIVSIAPIATEAVFALNAQDALIGVSDFCDWPPQAKNRPTVGGDFNPSFERLTALNPDLIIVLGRSENLTQFCQRDNIRLIHITMANLQSLYDDLYRLGRVLHRSQNAQTLCTDIRDQLHLIETTAEKTKSRPRVFFVLFRRDNSLAGLATASAGTTYDDMIRIAGGQNIFGDLDQPYPQISKESLVKRCPDIIIEPRNNLDDNTRKKLIDDWRQLPSLPAVQNNRIYFPPADLVLRPGPRVVKITRSLAECIHPELFDE